MHSSPLPKVVEVSISGARVEYAGQPLFEALDLTLPAGEWTCLLGPSGIGKTSLLRLIAGLMNHGARGAIRCGDGRPAAGRIAYMAQQDLLLPWLSARKNVALGRRLRGEPGDEARVRDLLGLVGLDDRLDYLPAALSGGQRQRVALARTLMEDRPIVLMDEPFSGLDAINRFRIQTMAARLLTDRTVLLVTHDPMEALRLGHRIFVMRGAPASLGTPIEPEGSPPRDPTDRALLGLQADLLARLGAGRDAA